ncbi:MAG: hypothetical protein HYT83_01555, partial [Candidatus Levybacteria bacterium]|nr:hypothetical protein [Candidatus Levybacteria bacterium]
HLDTVGNVRRFQEARMRIIVRETIAMLSKELVGESSTRIRGAVKDRIKTVADGKDKTIRKKPIEERKAKLEAERKGLDDQTAKIQAYQTKVKEPNTAEQTFRTEFPDQVALGRNIDQAITQTHTNITNLTDEINNRELNATTNAQTIADARIGALPALVTTGNPALDQQNQRERYAKVLQIQTDTSKEYEKHTENLKNKLTELKRQAIKLNELRKHDEEYRKEIREAEDAVIESTGENLDKIKANFDKVTTGWGVPQTELTTKTVDELMASANAVYTTDRTAGVPAATRRGWPASKNNVAANRELLVLAIAEAKAQKAEGDDPNSFTRQPDYLEITGWTITEDQLRSLPENQLKGLLNILYASDVAAGIPAAARRGWNATGNTDPNNTLRLRNAVAESRNRFLLRHTLAVAEKTKDLDAQIVKAAKEIETIDKEPTDKISDALIMTDLLLERQGEVFANSGKLKTQIDTLLNTTAVGNTDTEYSKTERALKQPKGYYEILNLLFDYQHGIKSTDPELTPDREESFKKISTLLPPARLAKLIDLSFNLGLATAGVPFTIEDVLFQLEGEIKNTRNISYPEIHEGFSNLVTTLGKEAIV